ncbi:MAG: copper resistance protein CopC [Thermoleophilia bacterium]
MNVRVTTVLAASVLVLGTAGIAAAHTALRSSSPASGATVMRSPTVVVLTFNEPIRPRKVTVLDRRSVNLVATVTRDRRDTRRVRVRVRRGVPGVYRVSWTVAGADGHLVRGAYTFRVR